MEVRVVADADWLPDLEANLSGDVVRDPGLTRDPNDAEVLVVPMDAAAAVRAAYEDRIPVPVVWVVPKDSRHAELERLSASAPASRFVFDPECMAVVDAATELDRERTQNRRESRRQEPRDRAAASMEALWKQFQGTMFERVEALESVGADLLEGSADADLEAAHHAAHKLHGSLGTFGLHRGSELASELESLVEAGLEVGALDPGDRYRFSELVVGIRREVEAGRTEPTDDEDGPRRETVGVLLIVESDPDRLEKLRAAAAARGWRPARAGTAEEARRRLQDTSAERPRLAVLDPAAGDPETLEALLTELATGLEPVPVVFQGRTRTLDERIQAVTLGARVFVDREASPEAVLGRAESLLENDQDGDAKILAVDDDPAALRVVSMILRGAGFTVRTLSSPLEFWKTLEAVEPDMVLLDVKMPQVNGYQLCRAIRSDSRWADLPVLFLTARSSPSDVIAGFEAGCDDFVVKPVAGPELLARVEHRLARLGHGEATRDEETGLTGRAVGRERLETQIALAARYDESVTVAIIRLDGADPDTLDREVVRLAGRLQNEARPEDIVARWDRGELMVARYGEEEPATQRWLERYLPTGQVGVAVGLAVHPAEGNAESLLERAVAGLADEGARLEAAGGPGTAERADLDIVIVEDDEALGALLVQTLDERGYSTHWLQDGAEAAALLAGPKPAMRASLIILDVGLPGMDGLSILRLLARDRITRRTRVLMLTARSAESEVVKALELGAFDHVPKPFSVAELIHRVRRALGDRGGA